MIGACASSAKPPTGESMLKRHPYRAKAVAASASKLEKCGETFSGKLVTIEETGARFVVRVAGGPGEPAEKPIWRGDLNGDKQEDLMLYFGHCGNWGECMAGVYVRCSANTFAEVIAPQYFFRLGLGKDKTEKLGAKWQDIFEIQRGGSGGGAKLNVVHWHFDGSQYLRDAASSRSLDLGKGK